MCVVHYLETKKQRVWNEVIDALDYVVERAKAMLHD